MTILSHVLTIELVMFVLSKLLSILERNSLLVPCVHPETSERDIHPFIFQSLVPYETALPNLQPYTETPIAMREDSNVDIAQNKALFECVKEIFNPHCATD
jgi:hypothetical protein